MKEKEKVDVKNYIFSIVVLSVILCISLAYNFIGGFHFDNITKYVLEIGDDVTIKLDGIGAQSKAFALEGTSLPGDTIKQKLQITIPDIELTNLVLRAKVTLNDQNLEINGFSSWEQNLNDFYYYFTSDLYKNQSLGLFSEIILPEDIMLKSNYVYYVNVVIELFYSSGLNA